jgi:lipocalin-like protein
MATARLKFLQYALLVTLFGGLLVEWARFRLTPLADRTAPARAASVRDKLVGTWKLISAKDRMKDGSERFYPELGAHGKGYLMYTADGHMCAQLMNPDRPKWKAFDQPTDAEKISAIEGFSAYCGRYEVDEEEGAIVHLPELAWSPNFIGTRQLRPYTLQNDTLTFAGKPLDEPDVESYSITWKKVPTPGGNQLAPGKE